MNHLSPEESESEIDLSSVSPSGAIRTRFSSLNDVDMGEMDSGSADVDSSESFSEMSLSEEDMSVDEDEDEDYRAPNARAAVTGESPREKDRLKKSSLRSVKTKNGDGAPRSRHFAHEVKAAHALLHLHMQEATKEDLGNDPPADESACRSTLGLELRPSSLASSRKRRRASL